MFKTYIYPDGHKMETIEFGHGDLMTLTSIDEENKRYLGILVNNEGGGELGKPVGEKQNFYSAKPPVSLSFVSIEAIDNVIRMLENLKTIQYEEENDREDIRS